MSEDVPTPSGAYQVVARRFRPATFGEVVGQEGILASLRSALGSGRVPHAFLFSGSRGVGKTTTARILARALNCEHGPTPDPCGTCPPCRTILAGSNPDVIEIDAASHNLVDDVRALRDSVGFASMGSRYKVYILDEVHMLTRSAFNAFLKTLEEPPARVVFVLATTEIHKVPDTIRSRCQVHLFGRVGEEDIVKRLQMIAEREGAALPQAVLEDIAVQCRGGMRDAESSLERILPVARERGAAFDLEAYRELVQRVGSDRSLEVVAALLAGTPGPALHFARALQEAGCDEREALGEVLEHLRALLLLVVDGSDTPLVAATGAGRESLLELAAAADEHQLDAMIQAGLNGRDRIRRLEDRGLVLETTLLHMARAGQLQSLGELVEAVRAGALTGAAPVAPGAVARPAPVPPVPGGLKARLVAAVSEKKGLLARTVELCQVRGPDDEGVVTLTLDTDQRMHRDRMDAPDVQGFLTGVLANLLGGKVTLRVRRAGGEPVATGAPRKQPGSAVRRVAERFDGNIVDLDDDRIA